MSQVLEIVSLQALDSEGTALRAKLADAEHRLEGDEELIAAQAALAEAEAQLADMRKTQRKLDADIQDLGAKITKEEGRLYGGSVTAVKELKSLQHEVEGLHANRAKLEERLLEVLTELETATAAEQEAARTVAALNARWATQSVALRTELKRMAAAIARIDAQRIEQTTKVDPANLRLYESLRPRKNGIAVARVTGAMCGGCRVSIPDGMRRQLLGPGRVSQCPNCERILTVA